MMQELLRVRWRFYFFHKSRQPAGQVADFRHDTLQPIWNQSFLKAWKAAKSNLSSVVCYKGILGEFFIYICHHHLMPVMWKCQWHQACAKLQCQPYCVWNTKQRWLWGKRCCFWLVLDNGGLDSEEEFGDFNSFLVGGKDSASMHGSLAQKFNAGLWATIRQEKIIRFAKAASYSIADAEIKAPPPHDGRQPKAIKGSFFRSL